MRNPGFRGSFGSASDSIVWVLARLLCATAGFSLLAGNPPTARIDYAANFFPPLGGIILHGGWRPIGNWQPMTETWKLDATGWVRLTDCFGGEAAGTGAAATYPTATWEWNGTDWQEFTPGITPPVKVTLTIRRLDSGQVRVAWPNSASNGVLRAKERLDPALEWLASGLPVVTEDECSVTFVPAGLSWFSRLQQP